MGSFAFWVVRLRLFLCSSIAGAVRCLARLDATNSPVYFCKTTTLLFICRKSRFFVRVTLRSTLTKNRDFLF